MCSVKPVSKLHYWLNFSFLGKEYDNGCFKKDFCAINPCKNGGSCFVHTLKYRILVMCYCYDTHTGDRCEELIRNECDANECLCENGATCYNEYSDVSGSSYRCKCSAYFTGKNCNEDVDECQQTNPPICLNGGLCSNYFGGFHCDCQNGFYGFYCQNYNPCLVCDPCQNNGTCIMRNNVTECSCKTGFSGRLCQKQLEEVSALVQVWRNIFTILMYFYGMMLHACVNERRSTIQLCNHCQ